MHRRPSGQALVEFALVVPSLLLLLFGIIEYGRILNAQMLITNASREGARRGAVGDNDAAIQTAVNNYLQGAGLMASTSTTITRSTVNGTNQINVQLNYPLPMVLPVWFGLPNPLPVQGNTIMRIE